MRHNDYRLPDRYAGGKSRFGRYGLSTLFDNPKQTFQTGTPFQTVWDKRWLTKAPLPHLATALAAATLTLDTGRAT